ncbi:MAG: N5-carboxyaminoimidazole ribonucleotide synthase [Armatimonadota bacterium]|nr:MAG: N5-carboxyaminoimidazole ribonucleotide synthase [Armatimonadota bacterium]
MSGSSPPRVRTVGILGGGQLARMLALAGIPLGLRFVFASPQPGECAFELGRAVVADWRSLESEPGVLEEADVVTWEFENISLRALRRLQKILPVFPSPEILAVKQDRLREKEVFRSLGIPTADFVPVDTIEDASRAFEILGNPLVLKTRSHGYDGKGQVVAKDFVDLEQAVSRGGHLLAEQFVQFDRELSVVGVRTTDGCHSFYPVTENIHREGILRVSRCRPDDPKWGEATEYTRRLMDYFGYTGVLAIEFFEKDGGLLANEFSPRVHNTGHWTIEGAETSQFENHLRAVVGWEPGSTAPVASAAMVNCIGHLPAPEDVARIPGAHLHIYGKAIRPRRKVGHVTVRAESQAVLEERLQAVGRLLNEAI